MGYGAPTIRGLSPQEWRSDRWDLIKGAYIRWTRVHFRMCFLSICVHDESAIRQSEANITMYNSRSDEIIITVLGCQTV